MQEKRCTPTFDWAVTTEILIHLCISSLGLKCCNKSPFPSIFMIETFPFPLSFSKAGFFAAAAAETTRDTGSEITFCPCIQVSKSSKTGGTSACNKPSSLCSQAWQPLRHQRSWEIFYNLSPTWGSHSQCVPCCWKPRVVVSAVAAEKEMMMGFILMGFCIPSHDSFPSVICILGPLLLCLAMEILS